MGFFFRKTPFYFLRHAETDHNVHRIYDDFTEIPLNENGRKQALQVRQIFQSLQLSTICSSPLLRVQQTKEIVLGHKNVQDVVLEEFRECPGALWRLFLAAETRSLTTEEWAIISEFLFQVKSGLEKALEHKGPLLIIAHGGTYWALSHLLHLKGDRKIGNCIPIYITPDSGETWKAEPFYQRIGNV